MLDREARLTRKDSESAAGSAAGSKGKRLLVGGFDREALVARLCGDEEIVRQVLAVFSRDFPVQLEALRGALSAGDAAAAQRQAHRMKGSASNVGAAVLHALCVELETRIRGREADLAYDLLGRVEGTFQELQRHLTDTES